MGLAAACALVLALTLVPSVGGNRPPVLHPLGPRAARQYVRVSSIPTRPNRDLPDDVSGRQVHFLYVIPHDGRDRRLDVRGKIADAAAAMNRWLAARSGGKTLPYDTYRGRLDVSFVRLPSSDADGAARGEYLRNLIQFELRWMGFDAPNKVLAVFYDGRTTSSCGTGAWPPMLPGTVAAFALQGGARSYDCGAQRFAGPGRAAGYLELSELHEILHTVGFAPTCAPHFRPHGHVADSPHDLMYAGGKAWEPTALDAGHDDYFRAGIPHCPDLATSGWLVRRPPVAR